MDSKQVHSNFFQAPPQPGSIQFLYDEAQYQWGKMQRNTPRGDQAVADARVGGDGVPNAFSEAFGIKISKETHQRLLSSCWICAKTLAT